MSNNRDCFVAIAPRNDAIAPRNDMGIVMIPRPLAAGFFIGILLGIYIVPKVIIWSSKSKIFLAFKKLE
jgi:hypothetical protein